MRKRMYLFSTALLFIASLCLMLYRAPHGTVYVSPSGNNNNAGTKGKPVKTVQQGVDIAKPGDSILLAPGIYRETVSLSEKFGTSKPIRIYAKNENGKQAVVMGSEPSSSLHWNPCDNTLCPAVPAIAKNHVYTTTLAWDEIPTILTETMPDGATRQLPLARSPNEQVTDPNKYHEFWWHAASGSSAITALQDPTHLTNAPLMSGGRAYIMDGADRCGTYMYVLPVKNHNRVTGTLETEGPIGALTYGRQENGISQYTSYYVDNAVSLLDSPGEWFFDQNTKALYLWPIEKAHPKDLSIEIGRREIGIHIDRSRVTIDNISIQNINDHGYYDHPTGAIVITPNHSINSINLRHIHSSHSGYGILAQPQVNGRIQDMNITDTRMDTQSKSAISLVGQTDNDQSIQKVLIDRSIIQQTGFPYGEAAVSVTRSSNVRVTHQTIQDVASYGIHVMGYEKDTKVAKQILIAGNTIERACQNSSGCAALKIFGGKFSNAIVKNNVLRDTQAWSYCVEARDGRQGHGIGVFISNASGIKVVHNQSTHNTAAAFVAFTRQIAATDNIFYGNTASDSLVGISLESSQGEADTDTASHSNRHTNSVVARNTLLNNDTALSLDPAYPQSLTIFGNTFVGNTTALLFRGTQVSLPANIPQLIPSWRR